MQRLLRLIFIIAITSCWGCARNKPNVRTRPPNPNTAAFSDLPTAYKPGNLIVTPEDTLAGKVAMVNAQGRFVVLSFPLGHMPALDQRLNLYRRGLKVGEVKITGPQRDDTIVADIVDGNSEVGDEAKTQ